MELCWIEDFMALEKSGNFTAASELRHTTQSAFSRRVQRLEDWAGAELFDREVRPVALTAAGVEFSKRLPTIREDILDMQRIARSGLTDLLCAKRIYTTNTLAVGLIHHWLERQAFENVSLTISSVSACLRAYEEGRCDISIVPGLDDIGADVKVLTQDAMVLVFPRNPKTPLSIKESVLTGAYMSYAPGTAYGQFLKEKIKESGLKLHGDPWCESASAEALYAFVRAGKGAAWLPRSLLNKGDKTIVVQSAYQFSYPICLYERETTPA